MTYVDIAIPWRAALDALENTTTWATSRRTANDWQRRTPETGDLPEVLPLTARARSFALRLSDGKVCPIVFSNGSAL